MPHLTSQDGTTIAYETVGNGPAVILVDGAMCFRDSGPMRPIAEKLAGQFTVYLYDRRGRGGSGDTLPFAVEREIEDIDALITEAGGNACLFGLSSGAALVLRAAENLGPSRINRMALYEPPFRDADDSGSAAAYTADLSAALDHDRWGDAVET
ncbi:MAG: alpha/beta hydrolase, partial [Terrimesophilobacter sp.]